MSSKARNAPKNYARSKRTKDKFVKVCNDSKTVQSTTAGLFEDYCSVINDVLQTAVTAKGLRWTICIAPEADDIILEFRWAICLVERGNILTRVVQANALATGHLVSGLTPSGNLPFFYNPDEKVIVHGTGIVNTGNYACIEGNTKAMRKMKPGDNLVFYFAVAQVANVAGSRVLVNSHFQMVLLT